MAGTSWVARLERRRSRQGRAARETEGIDCHVLIPLALFGVQSMTRYVRLLFFSAKKTDDPRPDGFDVEIGL